jgi:predicted NAD-dependent protein-ADP-ribosyltransferase YbiA (DUF1768 family)
MLDDQDLIYFCSRPWRSGAQHVLVARVTLDGTYWPTAEHFFRAQKFLVRPIGNA